MAKARRVLKPTIGTKSGVIAKSVATSVALTKRRLNANIAALNRTNAQNSTTPAFKPTPLLPGQAATVGVKQGAQVGKVATDNTLVDIAISKSVGKKGGNIIADVKKIQSRLKVLGFLSASDFKTENIDLFAKTTDTDVIAEAKIAQTIDAIKTYESTVEYVNKVSGTVTPKGNTLKMMNAHAKKPSTTDVASIKAKRNTISITTKKTEKLDDLTGSVGKVDDGNKVADLQLVQKALKDIGYLSAFTTKNSEDPAAILKRHPAAYKLKKDKIKKEHIPLTIKAINNFQKKKSSSWATKKIKNSQKKDVKDKWKGTKTKEFVLDNNTSTGGAIKKGDATFIVLKGYESNTLKFKVGTTDKKYTFSNFVKSGDAIDSDGFSIIGKAKSADIKLETIKKFGLTEVQAKALKYISTHEGNFDAINTYDQAIVSFGFIQFAGGGRSFNQLLALIKKDFPAKFKTNFQDYGIDVEYLEKNGAITKSTTVATDISTGELLRGTIAEDYIRKNVQLIGTLVMAGHDKDVQESQIKLAANNYAKPAAKFKFRSSANVSYMKANTDVHSGDAAIKKFKASTEYADLNKTAEGKKQISSGELKLQGTLVSDVLSSDKATTAILNMAINDGTGGASIKISKGVRDYVIENNITTLAALKTASEIDILKKIKPYSFKPNRVQAIIDAADI